MTGRKIHCEMPHISGVMPNWGFITNNSTHKMERKFYPKKASKATFRKMLYQESDTDSSIINLVYPKELK